MIERILLPLDRSPLAECTVAHGLRLAKAFGARLVLLSVIEPDHRHTEVDSLEWRMVRAEVEGYLNRVAGEIRGEGVPVETRLLEGRAAERILDLAKEANVDLVVLSSHGRGGVSDFPLSGTVSKVLARAATSVMIVRPGELAGHPRGPPRDAAATGYHRILVPFDCTKRSEWSARLAAQLARSEGGELVLTTIVPIPEVLGDGKAKAEADRIAQQLVALNSECAEKHLAELEEILAAEDLAIRRRVIRHADVLQTLEALVAEEDVSLVVLSAHGRNGSRRWPYGVVATGLLEHLTAPVVVFQDAPERGNANPAGRGPRSARAVTAAT